MLGSSLWKKHDCNFDEPLLRARKHLPGEPIPPLAPRWPSTSIELIDGIVVRGPGGPGQQNPYYVRLSAYCN
jgi:hypothetical protein